MDFVFEIGIAVSLFAGIISTAFVLGRLCSLFLGYIRPQAPPKHSKAYAYIALLLLGVVSGIIFQGSFFNFLFVICGVIYFLPLFLLVVTIFALVQMARRKHVGSLVKSAPLVWGTCALAIALSGGVGYSIHAWQINSVRSYVERAMPVLDAIKAREGVYPATLPVAVLGNPPVLLQNSSSYTSDGKTFRFEYWDPAGMMDAYELDSSHRAWIYFD